MDKSMQKRNGEWEDNKRAFKLKKMLEFKDIIVEYALGEKKKVDIRAKTEQMARERAQRDADIAKKKAAEGNADFQDARMAEGKKADVKAEDMQGWTRGLNVNKSASEQQAERPQRHEDRKGDDGP